MIRNQYLIYIHSLGCNTPNQFSFLQSWDICAAAEPIVLSLLCEDTYAIKYYTKKWYGGWWWWMMMIVMVVEIRWVW